MMNSSVVSAGWAYNGLLDIDILPTDDCRLPVVSVVNLSLTW